MQNSFQGSERRKGRRVKLLRKILVDFIWLSPGDKDKFTELDKAETRDMGGGGLCFYSPLPFKINKKLTLFFSLPDRKYEPIQSEVRIVWCQKEGDNRYRVGVEFQGLNEQDRKEIIDFVEKEFKRSKN